MLVVCDYKQAELRILAFYSQDEYLLEGANKNHDLHVYTTSMFFNVDVEKVLNSLTSSDAKVARLWQERRQVGKKGNFLVVYGGGAYALSKLLGVSTRIAEGYIKNFFNKASKVIDWSKSIVDSMYKNEYVMSCYGRKRRFPLVSVMSNTEKEDAEKEAPNAIIQGTSVDFCNYSGIALAKALNKYGYFDMTSDKRVKFISQKHDEWLLEVPIDWFDKIKDIIIEQLQSPKLPVNVPMVIDMEISEKNWGETKSIGA